MTTISNEKLVTQFNINGETLTIAVGNQEPAPPIESPQYTLSYAQELADRMTSEGFVFDDSTTPQENWDLLSSKTPEIRKELLKMWSDALVTNTTFVGFYPAVNKAFYDLVDGMTDEQVKHSFSVMFFNGEF